MRFEDIFADWVIANYVDDPNALGGDGLYGYRDFVQPAPVLDVTYDDAIIPSATARRRQLRHRLYPARRDGRHLRGVRGRDRHAPGGPRRYSGDYAWWSNRGDDFDTRLTRTFDFSRIEAGEPISMTAAMWWDIERTTTTAMCSPAATGASGSRLPASMRRRWTPGGNAFGPGYTALSHERARPVPDEMLAARWVSETFDLSAYAGDKVQIRFEYVTDDAVNNGGWFVDDVAIPAVGYSSDFEDGADGWTSEGWLLTDNHLQQRWLVQALTLDENRLAGVDRPAVDPSTGAVSFRDRRLGRRPHRGAGDQRAGAGHDGAGGVCHRRAPAGVKGWHGEGVTG